MKYLSLSKKIFIVLFNIVTFLFSIIYFISYSYFTNLLNQNIEQYTHHLSQNYGNEIVKEIRSSIDVNKI